MGRSEARREPASRAECWLQGGAEDPYGFNAAREHSVEQLDCFQPRLRCDTRRAPKPSHPVDVGRVRETHMGGELIGKPADFAPAHRIGLAG